MLLLIDNYDSFTYNLAQLMGAFDTVYVARNDALTLDQIEQRAREAAASDPTEVHIVGGVHPDHDLDFYCEAIRRVRRALPSAAVKAFTAVELLYMIRKGGTLGRARVGAAA